MLFILFELGLAAGAAAARTAMGAIFAAIMLLVVAVKGLMMMGMSETSATSVVLLSVFIPLWALWAYLSGLALLGVWAWVSRSRVGTDLGGVISAFLVGIAANAGAFGILCMVYGA